MEKIKDFIEDTQLHLSPTKNIIISVGKFSENNTILNCHMKEAVVKNLFQILTQKKIKYETLNSRIYREGRMEYSIDASGENNRSFNFLKIANIVKENIGFRAKLVQYNSERIEDFPCKMQYCDEFNRSIIIVHYNSLLDIHIITEQREMSILKVEVHITRQNIYTDKLLKSVEDVIKLIIENISTFN